ncbi:MAG: DEAD/DEAH box helicase [Deltaproteobacteria bacterium]|nr:DEAD/DEAH box helicase [Deltaproteobacteria bacterium]
MKTKQTTELKAPRIEQIEFFRQGMALVPDPTDKRPGVSFFVPGNDFQLTQRFCTCTLFKKRTCAHQRTLTKAFKSLGETFHGNSFVECFSASIWYRMAVILGESSRESRQSVDFKTGKKDKENILKAVDSDGEILAHYYSPGPDRNRFLERCASTIPDDGVPNRAWALSRLRDMTRTENEKLMNAQGFKTRKQVFEASFWYKCAYHCFREFESGTLGESSCSFEPAISQKTGRFTVSCLSSDGQLLIRLFIPRNNVRKLLSTFQEYLPGQHALAVHPIPLKSIFKITQNTELDLEIRPQIQLIQENGEETFFENNALEKFTYGNLVYIKEMGILAQLETPDKPRKFKAPVKMVLKKSQVPVFLEEYEDDLNDGPFLLDGNLTGLKIFKEFDRIEIRPETLERDWWWLSIQYGFGNQRISLAEILKARNDGQRYITTDAGWIDCDADAFKDLSEITDTISIEKHSGSADTVRISRMDLFRLQAQSPKPLAIEGEEKPAELFKKMLALKPAEPLPHPEGLRSILRHYQALGTEWIHFLHQNGFGGLLCDDMGLGKTHEVMAFMVGLLERGTQAEPFLVVCPTTVLSHWKNILNQYAPVLKPAIYHGQKRDLRGALGDHPLLLTSYGILRRDIEALETLHFSVAVFDEIQNLKNTQTQLYHSAKRIQARMKLGLTGTPIENRLGELKALLDLTLPGYLGKDANFDHRYVNPIENRNDEARKAHLSALIAPFTLRRKKESVLGDLPDKIEDIRTCELSEDQVKLYRDAISSRGNDLVNNLREPKKTIPYIHIFSLLNLLKQICNHPALINGNMNDYQNFQSGKWDLFKELLAETLQSGQKVVIYSQFLNMIEIMEKYLAQMGTDFVSLTGRTTNREKIIYRFNEDSDCRVFVGSLKAGGVGIDLVAASVVIHYDRWWNAAKEDQATDRVHRIGQKRGVQVFKLVTEGTLEEKIAAIIAKKRNLMDSVVEESDPAVMKSFTREELIELLEVPRNEPLDSIPDQPNWI